MRRKVTNFLLSFSVSSQLQFLNSPSVVVLSAANSSQMGDVSTAVNMARQKRLRVDVLTFASLYRGGGSDEVGDLMELARYGGVHAGKRASKADYVRRPAAGVYRRFSKDWLSSKEFSKITQSFTKI